MRVLVVGGTRGCGRELVRAGSTRGHDMTALGRSSAGAPVVPRVSVVSGDAGDDDTVRSALAEQDAVVICVGGPIPARQPNVCARTAEAVLRHADAAGVRRVLYVSCVGASPRRGVAPWWFEYVLVPLRWRARLRDHAAAETRLRDSTLDWTIVRPAPLTNGAGRARYRIFVRDELVRSLRAQPIARADVAHFVLDELERNEYPRQAVLLCN